MWDAPNKRRRLTLSLPLLVLGLITVLSVGLSGYLLSRADVRQLVLASVARPSAASAEATAAPALAVARESVTETSVTAPQATQGATVAQAQPGEATAQIDAMLAQLTEMQSALQKTADHLAVAPVGTPQGPTPLRSFAEVPVDRSGEAALLAEIEQLYQSMRPLMVQLEVASATNRSPSELEAMRSQMASIHARLTGLLAQLEQARAPVAAPVGAPTGLPELQSDGVTTGAIGDEAADLQLEQMLSTLEGAVQQLQGNWNVPAP